MKRAILPTFALFLLLAVPAVPQEGASGDELRAEVEALKERAEKQEKRIQELEKYAANQKKQGTALAKDLARAEKEGFLLPAPNNDAKQALLGGLKEFAAVAAGGEPRAEPGEGE